MLEIGQPAPDFTLPNQDGERISLSDFRGKKVVLFSFPKASTPGCTTQACGFRDEFPLSETDNVVVLGISTDSQMELRIWKNVQNLHYDLLSDTQHRVIEAYGAWGVPVFGIVKIPIVKRSYWGIDEDGILRDMHINIKPDASVQAALKFVHETA